jgi:hypothetical protein
MTNTGINTNTNVGIGSVVRGHQFRRGVILGYARVSGFPIVRFDGETDGGYAVHPAQLISETDYQQCFARQLTAAEMVSAPSEWTTHGEDCARADAIKAILDNTCK